MNLKNYTSSVPVDTIEDELSRLWAKFYSLKDVQLMRQCLRKIGRLMARQVAGK